MGCAFHVAFLLEFVEKCKQYATSTRPSPCNLVRRQTASPSFLRSWNPYKPKTIWEKNPLGCFGLGMSMDCHVLSNRFFLLGNDGCEAMKNLRSRALLCSSRRDPWRKHLEVNGFTNSMLYHRYWCNENLSSWMPNINRSNGLVVSMLGTKSRSLHQLEENKYPKMPNILRNFSRWVSAMPSNHSSTISPFLQGWLGYLTKHCGYPKISPCLFQKTLQRNGRYWDGSFFLDSAWLVDWAGGTSSKRCWRLSLTTYLVKGCTQQPRWFFWCLWKVPSRGLTYPTLGKGKSSSKCHFWGIR